MRLLYVKPELRDLSQGSRIAFIRQLRHLSQDYVSDYLGLTGECKRRTMTRYEKGDRNPKDERVREIAKLLNVSFNSLKKYDYKKEYGKPFNYGFVIEDIENTKLKDLLHITQAENNKDIKMYSTEDLVRLQLIVIQELIKKVEALEKKESDN